jgi:hypothetical protein
MSAVFAPQRVSGNAVFGPQQYEAPSGPVEPSAPTVTISLVNETGTPFASLSSLKWAFFDEASPELLTAPVAKGAAESTDASGNLVIDVTGTSHTAGGIGWLVLSTSDGNPSGTYRQLCGPVTVA